MMRYELPEPRGQQQQAAPGLSPQHLEPLNLAVNQQGRQQAAMEERLLMLETRLVTAERQSGEAGRAYDVQQQRVAGLISDTSRAAAELNDLRMRYEGALSGTTQLQQQVCLGGGGLMAAASAVSYVREMGSLSLRVRLASVRVRVCA